MSEKFWRGHPKPANDQLIPVVSGDWDGLVDVFMEIRIVRPDTPLPNDWMMNTRRMSWRDASRLSRLFREVGKRRNSEDNA